MVQKFGRCLWAAFTGEIERAANGGESLAEQDVAYQPRPLTFARANDDIDTFAVQIDITGRDVEAHGIFRMQQLKATKARRQPAYQTHQESGGFSEVKYFDDGSNDDHGRLYLQERQGIAG